MATYEELTKMLDDYNPQPQQLGVNSFDGGMPQQEETPYQRMMRETYGAPAQAQSEETGLLGSIANRFGGQQPAANPNRGWLEDISDTAAGINATRILTEQQREADNLLWKYHYDKSLTDEQRQELKAEYDRRKLEIDKTAAEVQRAKNALQQSPNLIGNAGSHVLSAGSSLESMQEQYKYNLMGALAGAAAGSTVLPGLGTLGGAYAGWRLANAPSAVLVNYRDAEAGAMDAWHETMEKTGNKDLAEQAYWDAMKPNLAYAALATIPDIAIGGGVGKGVTRGIRKVLGKEVAEEAAEQATKGAAGKLAKAADAVDLDFADKAGNWVAAKTGLPMLGTAANVGARMTPEVFSEMGQEAEQGISTNAAVATALHQYDPNKYQDEGGWSRQRALDWLNSEEGRETLVDTAASTAFTAGLASAVGSIGSVVNGKRGNGQFDEFGNPNVKIQNAVTNNEFGDAVAVAKHDTSTNLVDRMRNLEGRIGYHASDGTNCARTIGLALAGTDYQDQINVDNFVAIARDKGQLKDPNNYVPKPGDLAVVNGGNHIVMVSENGGTIQNGSSRDGVYESAQSPLQMFGAVQYYISTSELSSGDYGVSGNLQGLNEEQRQQEYYQNLVAQENQRRADAIREVLGAKTHAQEQQEQAVSEAQKYQQDNASELGSIDEYYKAFTEQELSALSPEQRQSLKNSFDTYYSEKQNWSDTAAERVRTARGMYNQMVGQMRQQAPAAASPVVNRTGNNVQGTASPATNAVTNAAPAAKAETPVAETKTNAPAAPTAPANPTATPAAATTKVDNPVAQKQAKQTTEDIGPDEWEKRLQKATEDLGEAYRNGNITKEEYERRMQAIDDAYDTNVTQKRGVTQYSSAETGFMERQAAEQKAIDENVAKGNRVKFMGMVDDLYKKRKNGQTEEDKKLIASQTNAAFKTGLAMLDKGATAEEAFDAVKDSIGTEKQKAKAKAEAEKQAKKGEKKNAVTEQKSTELQKPEAEQGRDQDVNAKPEEGKREENKNGETAENKGKAEVRENGNNEGTVSEASGTRESGSISEDGRRREAEPVSGHEGGTGETVLRANDADVRDQKSDRGEDAASGLPEQSADVGGTANGQDAVRGELSTAEQTYNGDLAKTNKAVEDGTVSVAEAKKQAEAAANEYDKELDKAEEKAEAPTTGKGDPIIVSDSLRKAYEELKNIIVKVGKSLYRLAIVRSKANNDGVMRWETTNGKPVSSDEALRCLLYEAIKTNDNGDFVSLDEIIANLEKKKEQVGLTPNFQEALDLAKKLKKGNVNLTTTNNEQAKSKSQTSATEDEMASARKTYERKVENIQADLSFDLITKEKADQLMKEAQEEFKNALKKWADKSDTSTEKALNRYEEERNKWKAEDREKTRSLRITLGNKTYTPIISDADIFGFTRINGWTDPNTGEQIKGETGRLLRWIQTSLGAGAFVDAKLTPGNVLMGNALDDVIERLEQVKKELTERSKTGRIPRMSVLEHAKQLKAEGQNATIHFAEDITDTTPDNTTKYQVAYHGTDAVFDSFDLEHIGNGEGAQVHGWGLYFTKSKEIAKGYRESLAKGIFEVYSRGRRVSEQVWNEIRSVIGFSEKELKKKPETVGPTILEAIKKRTKEIELSKEKISSVEEAIQFLNDNPDITVENAYTTGKVSADAKQAMWEALISNLGKVTTENIKNTLRGRLDRLNKDISRREKELETLRKVDAEDLTIKKIADGGMLIEADIPEDDVMLNEQKSFDEQPKAVKEALQNIWNELSISRPLNRLSGKQIYSIISQKLGGDKEASLKLNENGVKGISYDGRHDGPCAVVFDDKAVQIMQRYEAAVTNKQEEIKRSLDELITEAKRAFKGAKGFRINRNDLIFTMPNGLEMKVNIKDQILLSAADEAKARKEHGLTDPNQRITVEGYARRLDKGSLVALSKESGRGTAFHETFHTVWDWVLTEKEKAAMLKHFTPIAEKLGIDVEEAMADGYRDWLLARQQHKGTLFGKLYQKVLDFVNGALRVLTGTENVHDIYRQIEEGKVWNRDEKGRFAKSENSETNQGEKKFLVTNNKITADTQVPVIDVTNVARANTTDPAVRAAIANSLIGKTFRILGSDGIGFTQKFDSEILPDGRVKKSKPNEHLVRGAGRNEFDKGLVREERQKALSIADTILDNAMYIEKHPDANHGTDTRYVDLYAAVQNGDKIYPIHIQAKEKDGSAGEFVVGKAMYYQLTRKGPLPATAKQLLASANDNGPSISVAQLLQNVKDKAGRPYVINGQLNYESAALNALPSGTKYSMKYANPNDTTDYKNNPLAAEVSTRQTKAKGSTEDSETQRLIADLDAVKKDPTLFKKLVDALKSLPGLATSERNTEKAAEIIINRIKDNIVYLYNQVPENIRERARKWYDGGNRVAKEWKKRYGISEHASAGIIAVLSPQKDWFTNMTLAERILDCIFGHANKMWTEEMSKQADGYSEMVEQPVKESKKEKAAREKRGEPVKTELVKVTHKSIVEGDENREALERARNKTLKQLLNAGDYEAAAIWIKCFDKAHNDRGYRVLTPEGGTGDHVKTSKGENAGAAWGDFGSIAKAVSIAVNPTWENISAQLGEQHKVRNFSNNLRFPGSLLNATIDTHAVGVGLMQPTSGGSQSVLDNFGEAGGSDIIGISGTYPLYFEAYRRAAAEISEREGRPLSAREMQSITWEAVRNLFPADMKTTEKEQSRIAGMLEEAKARLKRSKNKDAAIKKVKTEQETGEKLVDAALEKVESGENISDILAELKEQAKAKKLPRLVSLIEDAEKSVENHKKDKKKSKKPLDKKKLVNGIKNKWNGQEKFIQEVVEAEERIKAGVNEEEAYRDIKYKGKDQVRISNLFREADKQIKNLNDPVKVKEILDGVRKMVYNIATKGTDQLQKFSWESTPDDVPLSGTYDRSNVKITPFDNSAGGNDRFTVGFNIDPTKYLSPKNAELFKSLVESGKAEDKTQAESVLSKALKFATDWILAEFDIRENVEPTLTFQGKDGKLTVGYTVEISNPQQTVAVAKMFGRLFDPESVIATGTKEVLGTTGKSMAIELPAGWGPKEISELSNKLGQITDQEGNPLVATHSTSDGQMTFVNTSDWSDSAVLEDVKRAVPELNVYSTDEFATILDKNSYEDNSKEGGQHKREDYIGRAIAQRLASELNPTEGQPVPGNGKQVAEGNRSGSKKKNSGQNERVQRKSKEAEQPAETGKIKTSIRAQVNFEVAPDPHNEKLKQRWGKLTTEEKQEASRKVSEKMVPKVLKYLKVIDPDAAIKAQIGGYMEDTNPSLCINVEPNEALKVSNALGHVFSQDSMMFISPKETDGSFRTGAIHIKVDPNIGVEETDKLYKKLRTIKDGNGAPLVTGHTTVDGEMLILNDDSRIAAGTLAEMINDLIPDYEIMTSEVFAGFPEKEGYGYADSEQGAVDGKTYDEGLNLLREETSRELEGELDSAEGRRVSKNDTGLVQGERSGNQEAEVASSRGLLGKTEEGTGLRGTGGITEQTNEGTQGDEGASSMPKFSVRQEQQEQTEKQAELAQQKKDIRKQYEGTKQWMKAPNGEPSKLNEDQWVTVRTPQFKEWFGDWENDPENASKVVDENGEPRVVYHGTKWTPTKKNGTFDKRRAGQNFDFVEIDYNFFFTASEEMAKGYGHALPLFLNIRNPEIYENEDHDISRDEDSFHDALITAHDNGNDGVIKVNDVEYGKADGVIYRGVAYDEAEYDKYVEEIREKARERAPIDQEYYQKREELYKRARENDTKNDKEIVAALSSLFADITRGEKDASKKVAQTILDDLKYEHKFKYGPIVDEVNKLLKGANLPTITLDAERVKQSDELREEAKRLGEEHRKSLDEYEKMLPQEPEARPYNDANVYACDEPNQIKDASGNNVSITKDSDNIHYSITSAAGKALDKVEAYVNRNVRTPNENTATGRASKAFNNTQNKNRAQTWTEWLRDRFEKFYREWIDKNDAIHNVDDTIEKITGKKLAEEDKIYNMVQGARAYAQGAADTLVQGSKEAFESLKDALGRGIDPKDTAAMKRLAELKKNFKFATVKEALEPIMKKDMDQKYPDYLEKNGINNWHDAFSNYLGARRILELVRLVEDKSLQYITHDKKEFTDFIDRHPEYEKFRPQPFAKGSWRTQVQNVAKNDPALAEKMAKELAKEYKFPKGVTREDLEALVREAPKEFDTSAQIYYQLQRNLLTMMELGHLIPADVHDKVNSMYNDYCPLMIDYSDTAGLDTAIAQFGRGSDSIANVDSMLKHVLQLGSERGLISPLESTYKSIQALTNRAERNKVAVHFIKTVANSKELQSAGILKQVPGSSPDAKNCIFTALINGKKVAFQTTQDLYGPIVGYDMPAAGIVEGMCRSAAQALRYGATTSPSFIVRNFIRDTIFAGVSSRNGFVPVVDSFRGMWAYLHDKELRGEFDAMGITAYNYFGSGESAVKSMEELMGEKDWAYLKAHPTELIKELIKYVPKKFAAASEVVEASTRMGEYMRARKAGKSMQEAALDARDVTLDFSRSGFYGQRVNMMVPFFNACIQGGDKMFNRMLFSKDPKVRAQTLRMLGLYIMLPSVALWFMHKDEPWYEELDPHIKMNNWIIGKFRIPKPQEAGIAFGSGIEAILDKIYNKDPKAGKEWVNAMREVLIPNLIPTVGLPILEWVTNYSLFRDKAIEGNRLKRLPAEMRYNNSTTEVSKLVGAKTGLSPVKLDNTIRGYTGTLGMLTAQAFDWFLEENRNQPSKKVTERVMVRDFFLNDMNMNRTSEEFYEMANAAQQQHAGYGKKGHPTPAVKAVNKALRDVSKQQKEIQEITNAKNIGPSTKRQMIDKKRELIKTIQRKTLQRYRDKFNV